MFQNTPAPLLATKLHIPKEGALTHLVDTNAVACAHGYAQWYGRDPCPECVGEQIVKFNDEAVTVADLLTKANDLALENVNLKARLAQQGRQVARVLTTLDDLDDEAVMVEAAERLREKRGPHDPRPTASQLGAAFGIRR